MADQHVEDRPGTGTDTLPKPKTQRPSMWHVVMLNDDFTTMEFVVSVLQRFYNKSHDEAQAIAFQIHVDGKGIAGTYTHEVAETKCQDTMLLARQHEFPLRCDIQEA